YTIKLIVSGKTYSQPITVKPDPRVKTPSLAMRQIYTLSKVTYYGALDARSAAQRARDLHERLAALRQQATGALADAIAALDRKVEALEPAPQPAAGGRGGRGSGGGGRGARSASPPDTLSGASEMLAGVMNLLQGADVRPTAVQLKAIADARANAAQVMARWGSIQTVALAAVNTKLRAAGLSPISMR